MYWNFQKGWEVLHKSQEGIDISWNYDSAAFENQHLGPFGGLSNVYSLQACKLPLCLAWIVLWLD